jgi:hypothetical protein
VWGDRDTLPHCTDGDFVPNPSNAEGLLWIR